MDRIPYPTPERSGSRAVRGGIGRAVLAFFFDVNPELGDGRGEAGQDQASDGLVVAKDGFVPGIAASGQDGDLSIQGVDDPVFEQAVGQVLFALGLVIALDAAPRDDFGGQRGDPPAAPILGGTMKYDAQVGVAARDHVREPEAELVTAAVSTD